MGAVFKEEGAPPPIPKVRIKNGRIVVDGKKYEDLPDILKKTIDQDFTDIL